MDIFERIEKNMGPMGKLQNIAEGHFAYPKFTGPVSNHISFKSKKMICWSYNNYLGLANSNEIHEIDAFAHSEWGMTYPMGSRMMTGDTNLHDELERNLADFVKMEDAFLLNFGYQGMISVVDSLLTPVDVVISDAQCHACTIDGIRMHKGEKLIFKHNDMRSLEEKLQLAQEITQRTNGGILVITEGVFSMSGAQGKLKEICDLKSKYSFRLLVDDAHGFGVLGPNGSGAVCEHDVEDKVDLYFATFTKSMASFGAVICGKKEIMDYFKYNLRSQVFSKSLPMPVVYGLNERLKIVSKADDSREKLFEITDLLQQGLRNRNLLSDDVDSYITPVHFNIELDEVFKLQQELVYGHGVYCSIVIYPVIPKGEVIFRITPTSLHTREDVFHTLDSFDQVFKKYIKNESHLSKRA